MLITLIASAFVLSLLVIIHELGHFALARLSGIRVLRFSLGLGPKLLGFKRGNTEWALSWVPFGGYVKLAGMEAGEISGEEWEFYSKRIWVRASVIAAGPVFNFLLAALIFSLVIWATGVQVERTTRIGKVEPGSAAFLAGMEKGDEIRSLGSGEVRGWTEVTEALANASGEPVRVEFLRDGDRRESLLATGQGEDRLTIGIQPWIEPVVGGVQRGSPAAALGLKRGDRIVSVEGEKIEQWYDLVEIISANPGVPVRVVWQRGSETFGDTVSPQAVRDVLTDGELRTVGRLGILRMMEVEKLSPLASIGQGVSGTARLTRDIFLSLVKMVRREISPRTLGGLVSIVMLTGETASWGVSWLFGLIAFFSVNLFIINLLPVPPLDGGNLVLISLEGIRGRPISEKQRLVIQQVGMGLLIILIVYVTRNDVTRWLSR